MSSKEEVEQKERTFVLVLEAKESNLAIAFKQLLLALKDMYVGYKWSKRCSIRIRYN